MTDTNPPVGARVTVQGLTWQFHATAVVPYWRESIIGRSADYDHHCALNAAWRLQQERDQLQQRAEQAVAERDAQMRRAEEAEAAWTEEKQRNMEAEAGLAKLRALAVEAREVMRLLRLHGMTVVAHLLDSDDNAGQRLRDCLAALATPNQEPTP